MFVEIGRLRQSSIKSIANHLEQDLDLLNRGWWSMGGYCD